MDKRPFFVSADNLKVSSAPDAVYVLIEGLGNRLELAPGIEIALHLSADEAIRLAAVLERMALSAKGGSTPPK